MEGSEAPQRVSNITAVDRPRSSVLTCLVFFYSDHEGWMKELSYYDQHHVTDFLTAAKMQFIITIPLMQFAIIFWGERLINMNDNPEIHDLEYIRYLITA